MIHIDICTNVGIYVYVFIYTCIFINKYIYVYMYIYMYGVFRIDGQERVRRGIPVYVYSYWWLSISHLYKSCSCSSLFSSSLGSIFSMRICTYMYIYINTSKYKYLFVLIYKIYHMECSSVGSVLSLFSKVATKSTVRTNLRKD
jgi:hypothetical protein